MLQYHSLDELSPQNAWVTVGIFDGVHRGHQQVLQRLVGGAHAQDCAAVLITFDPHPAVVLGGNQDFKYLTTPEERLALLAACGVDQVIIQPFDRTFAEQTAEAFLHQLVHLLGGADGRPGGLRRIVIGHDAALGRGREGNAARLAEIGQRLGFSVEVVAPVRDEGEIISSTRIRLAVESGDVTRAAEWLGRLYTVSGRVVHGDGRGRRLQFPTANLQTPAEKLLPADGVYATWARVRGEKYPAATSIGFRPTFKTAVQRVVEVHLLNFDRDLYEQEIEVEFAARLRGELKFPSEQALIEQIRKDVARVSQLLGNGTCKG